MTVTVESVLKTFEQLTEPEKHAVTIAVMRRANVFGAPDLSEDEMALAAEDLFLALDREEQAAIERPGR